MPRSRSRSPRPRRDDRRSPIAGSRSYRRSDEDARGDYRRNRQNVGRYERHDNSNFRSSNNNRYRANGPQTQDSRPREGYRNRTYANHDRRDRNNYRNYNDDEATDRPTSNGFTFDDPAIVPKGFFFEHDRRENFTGTGGSHSFFKAQDRGRGNNRRSDNHDRYRNQGDRPRYNRDDRFDGFEDRGRRDGQQSVKSDYFGYRTDPLEGHRSNGYDRRGRGGGGFRPFEGRPFQKRAVSPTVWKHDKFEQIEKETRGSPKPEDVSD